MREQKCKEVEEHAKELEQDRDNLRAKIEEFEVEQSDLKALFEELVQEQTNLREEKAELTASLAARVLVQEHRIFPLVANWFGQGRLTLNREGALLDGERLPPEGATL